jgi:hypothetical protein
MADCTHQWLDRGGPGQSHGVAGRQTHAQLTGGHVVQRPLLPGTRLCSCCLHCCGHLGHVCTKGMVACYCLAGMVTVWDKSVETVCCMMFVLVWAAVLPASCHRGFQ